MTCRERVTAALRGAPTDRPAISFWQHFPGRDGTARDLARATVAFQRRYEPDFVKLMPTGMYAVLDYGVQVRTSDDGIGTTRFVSGPVAASADWTRLPAVAPGRGVLAEQVEAVRLVREALGPDVPILQTIFSPLTMASKLVGGDLSPAMVEAEEGFRVALERVARDVVAFGQACLRAGADGFFFATQLATHTALPSGAYERFGVPYDTAVLGALRAGSSLLILHLHGLDPFFDLADWYPVDGVNWHDRETRPHLAEALARTRAGLVGGIARMGAVVRGSPDAVAAEVRDAIAQTGGRRLVVAPGCVIPTDAPAANLLAARAAVGGSATIRP